MSVGDHSSPSFSKKEVMGIITYRELNWKKEPEDTQDLCIKALGRLMDKKWSPKKVPHIWGVTCSLFIYKVCKVLAYKNGKHIAIKQSHYVETPRYLVFK